MPCFSILRVGCFVSLESGRNYRSCHFSCYRTELAGTSHRTGRAAMATTASSSVFAVLACSTIDWSRVLCVVVVKLAVPKTLLGEIDPMAWNAVASEVGVATVPPCMVVGPRRDFGWPNLEFIRFVVMWGQSSSRWFMLWCPFHGPRREPPSAVRHERRRGSSSAVESGKGVPRCEVTRRSRWRGRFRRKARRRWASAARPLPLPWCRWQVGPACQRGPLCCVAGPWQSSGPAQ
jgi:hypothetical protein